MNQFDAAKVKYEKNRVAQARPLPKVEVAQQKEAPRSNETPPMIISISGPVELTLEVDYAGTLTTGQLLNLKAMLKKLLVPIGRVR
jgi:hypothetical protein